MNWAPVPVAAEVRQASAWVRLASLTSGTSSLRHWTAAVVSVESGSSLSTTAHASGRAERQDGSGLALVRARVVVVVVIVLVSSGGVVKEVGVVTVTFSSAVVVVVRFNPRVVVVVMLLLMVAVVVMLLLMVAVVVMLLLIVAVVVMLLDAVALGAMLGLAVIVVVNADVRTTSHGALETV
jgi:hypothetical protein